MKILVAAGLYPPEIGGPATYAHMLEEELPEHGHEIVTIPFGQVRHLPKIIRHIAYARLLFAASRRCDVVYALDPISVGVPALLVSVMRRKTFLLRLGGDYAWEQGQQRFGVTDNLDVFTAAGPKAQPLPVRLLSLIQAFVAKRATSVVVPSEYLKSIVKRWGVREERLVVIYSALFPLPTEESRTTLRSELAFTFPTIMSAGRLVPWKGYRVLIDVIADLKEAYPDIQLVIAGEGPESDRLTQHADQSGVREQVRFVGRLAKAPLGAAKKASDVFVLNTEYEGLSHELLEVMDLGTPVVSTDVGGNPELIEDGVSGLLVAFDDRAAIKEAVIRVLENDSLRNSLTQHARLKTKDFSREVVIGELVSLLEDITRG